MFARLVAYKDVHGDCNLPVPYEPDSQLGRWVSKQRSRKPSHERIASLDELDFIWDAQAAKWEEMYGKLVAYKTEHGHCNVRSTYEPDSQLGRWVTTSTYTAPH